MKAIGFITILMLSCLGGRSQTMLKDSFNIRNGLPSNWVYKTLEDDRGFLWIATDAGIARFDGKLFQVYTKKEGLPDIEVLYLLKEKNGRIWIHCQNNSLAYYDEIRNQFIDVTPITKKLNIKGKMRLFTPAWGGISIVCESGTAFFKDLQYSFYPYLPDLPLAPVLKVNKDGSQIRFTPGQMKDRLSNVHIYLTRNDRLISQRSIPFTSFSNEYHIDDDCLYFFKKKSADYIVMSGFSNDLNSIQLQQRQSKNDFYMNTFSYSFINMMHRLKDPVLGKDIMEVNVYDKKSGNFLFTVRDQCIAFDLFKDTKGNDWLSTIDKGLLKYSSKKTVGSYLPKSEDGIAYYGITTNKQGFLLMGNERGEIVEKGNGGLVKHNVLSYAKTEWQRNIVQAQDKIFTFSDGGIFLNYTKELKSTQTAKHLDSKVAYRLNDSIILSGSEGNFCSLNTCSEIVSLLPHDEQSINALASLDGNEIIIGTHNGLFSYDLQKKVFAPYHIEGPDKLNERISALLVTGDGLLWIATATNGLVIVQNHRIVSRMNEENGLKTNNMLALCKGAKQHVWAGSNQGVCKIKYSFADGKMDFKLQNISVIDGLSSNTIHHMLFSHDTLFATTTNGISYIPDSVYIPEIPIYLNRVKINNKDTLLHNQYQLKANQKNIYLQFAATNLNAYYSHAMYSFDEGKTWIRMEGNTISLEFESGEHPIWVRAVDVNSHRSQSILKIQISIATPFWKTWWFWVLTTILIQGLIGYRIYRLQQKKEAEKRKVELAKAHLASLEQQAFTSLMNPHFMFNALNSIQHFINAQDRQNANRFLSDFASLIRKNFEAAQQAFVPLEKEIENTNLYFRLEKMRFNDRFNYEILVDKNLDPEDWMMPTMILQPLVENALLHGIMPSKIEGKVSIHFKLIEGDLLIEIIDNGIGIENSKALKQGSTHRSRGMELIHKRLHALSFFCKNVLKLEYSVPFQNLSNPGNKISLLIPEALYYAWQKAQKNMKETISKA